MAKVNKQRQRNRQRDDASRPKVPQKDVEQHEDQHHPADQNIGDRFDRRVDQGGAVVKRLDLDAGRQFPGVELVDFLPDLVEDRHGLVAALQQDDTFHHVVTIVDADFPETNPAADVDVSQRLDVDRRAVLLGDHDVLDVLDAIDQADPPHVVILCA